MTENIEPDTQRDAPAPVEADPFADALADLDRDWDLLIPAQR